MKRWRHAPLVLSCGRCGTLIRVGEPVLKITVSGLSRTLRRCAGCAGEPVSIAEDVVEAPVLSKASVMQRLSEIMPERFDARMAAAGRDE